MDLQTLLSLATAFGLGGAVTSVVSGAGDRRKARADVRRSLLVVERLRWLTEDDDVWRAAVRELIATCLTARVPRGMTDRYVQAVRASRAIVRDDADQGRKAQMGLELSDYIEAVGVLIVDHLWHPWRTRVQRRGRLRRLDAEKARLVADGANAVRVADGHRGAYLANRYWDQ
ncbi:hypothetical protein F1C76_16865 [Geodermatophilaceae bacterium NBWT11]|nr:hypothetical protein F1C76_16865 [Geodermatophilaceae bacterium NBWT11]